MRNQVIVLCGKHNGAFFILNPRHDELKMSTVSLTDTVAVLGHSVAETELCSMMETKLSDCPDIHIC